jgi:hypothetical protein
MKELTEMTTGELIEELRQRREYDTALNPQLEELGAKTEALETEVAVLRQIAAGQIVSLFLAAGFDPSQVQGGPQA